MNQNGTLWGAVLLCELFNQCFQFFEIFKVTDLNFQDLTVGSDEYGGRVGTDVETLLKAKGFEECVAVISNSAATVIVKSEGLLPSDLAQIAEIVWEQAGISPSDIKVIEKA